jgi:hypothetical protein
MKSNKTADLFENKYIMDYGEAIKLVKSFFQKEMPLFELTEEYNLSSGYWGVRYANTKAEIFIGGERGLLDVKVLSENKLVVLSESEPLILNVEVASEKNIRFTLGVINRFFNNASNI